MTYFKLTCFANSLLYLCLQNNPLSCCRAERKKDAPRPLGMSGSTSSPAAPPILPSPLSVLPPPLTAMAAPVFYMPSTPGAANSPSIPASPHTPPFMMQAHRPISPSTFPFGGEPQLIIYLIWIGMIFLFLQQLHLDFLTLLSYLPPQYFPPWLPTLTMHSLFTPQRQLDRF